MIKILKIISSANTEGFDVTSGIEIDFFNTISNTTPLNWGDLICEKEYVQNNCLEKKDKNIFLSWITDYKIVEKNDSIKDLYISGHTLSANDNMKINRKIADSLLVFIPNGFLHSNKPRLAGKSPNEALLELTEGDTFQLCKNYPPKTQEITTFIVKRENLVLFLEKIIKTKKYEL